jgi:hypothetical protein
MISVLWCGLLHRVIKQSVGWGLPQQNALLAQRIQILRIKSTIQSAILNRPWLLNKKSGKEKGFQFILTTQLLH